jgi:HSP20 family protein
MAIVRWQPVRDLVNMQNQMNRVFDRFFHDDLWGASEDMSSTIWQPNVDVSENRDEFIVAVELPGMKKNDIHITFTNGALTVEGERKQEKEDKDVNYHRVERSYGKFLRTFQLPAQVDSGKIAADFKDGVLTVRLPKVEEVKPKEIEVKVS